MDSHEVKLEADGPIADRPYGGETGTVRVQGKSVKTSEWLSHLREKKYGKHIHSDGFLALECEPAYECPNCLFHGFFVSDTCHRCGTQL